MPDAAFLRRVLAALFLFGSVGTAAELWLLEHTEDVWQKAPLVLITIAAVVLAVLTVRPSAAGVRFFQLAMVAFIASGEVAVAYFQAHAPRGFWPIANGGELAALYSFVFLYFAAVGSGRWSVDSLRK